MTPEELAKDHRDNAKWYRDSENDPGHASWHDEAADLVERLTSEVDAKDREITRLREGLTIHGAHLDECTWWHPIARGASCNCGLDAALKGEG